MSSSLDPDQIRPDKKSSLIWVCTVCDNKGEVNSFCVGGNFCCQQITFANSMDPDQAQQKVGPDLGPDCLTF